MNELIRSHKALNQSVITTQNEGTLKLFMCLIGEFNKQKEYNKLIFSKLELWKLFKNEKEYRTKDFENLITSITKSEVYTFKNKDFIAGSMFSVEKFGEVIEVEINNSFKKYLFNGKDLTLMSKAKKKEKMSVGELEYYDKEVKMKSKELVLLNKAHILGLKGKYNVRLYTLLKQWDKVGKYEKNWNEFKEIMEMPKSYKACDIDKNILSKVKKELLKANIKITKIEKKKKGRSIDKIIIHFKSVNSDILECNDKVEEIKIADNGNEGLEIVEQNNENFELKKLIEKSLKIFFENNFAMRGQVNSIILNSGIKEAEEFLVEEILRVTVFGQFGENITTLERCLEANNVNINLG